MHELEHAKNTFKYLYKRMCVQNRAVHIYIHIFSSATHATPLRICIRSKKKKLFDGLCAREKNFKYKITDIKLCLQHTFIHLDCVFAGHFFIFYNIMC